MQVNSTLSVKTFDVGPMLNMIYLIWDKKTKEACLLYTSPSPRDRTRSRMPSSA